MNMAASNIGKRSTQTLINNLIQKDEIFNRKTPCSFDSLLGSNNKLTSVVNADTPVNVENIEEEHIHNIFENIN